MVLTGATKERIDLQSKLKANGDAVHSQESLEAFRSEPVHGQTERVTQSQRRPVMEDAWSKPFLLQMRGLKLPRPLTWEVSSTLVMSTPVGIFLCSVTIPSNRYAYGCVCECKHTTYLVVIVWFGFPTRTGI